MTKFLISLSSIVLVLTFLVFLPVLVFFVKTLKTSIDVVKGGKSE